MARMNEWIQLSPQLLRSPICSFNNQHTTIALMWVYNFLVNRFNVDCQFWEIGVQIPVSHQQLTSMPNPHWWQEDGVGEDLMPPWYAEAKKIRSDSWGWLKELLFFFFGLMFWIYTGSKAETLFYQNLSHIVLLLRLWLEVRIRTPNLKY